VAAKLCDLKDGRTLWVGDMTLKDECGTSRADIELVRPAGPGAEPAASLIN
jgi:hypothetical protein